MENTPSMQEEEYTAYLRIYMEDGEVLAVEFEDAPEYPFIILKDEPGKAIDGSWTVYSPLADLHEEVIDIEELYRYIGLSIVEFQPVVGYFNAGEMRADLFLSNLRLLADQAKIWDVRNKEGQ